MKSQMKTTLFAILPLVGALCTSPVVSADDDRGERERDRMTVRERDRATMRVSERDLRSFEAYLDSHWKTAQELYRDPDLVNNRRYVRKHTALNRWLKGHAKAAREIRANPRAFLWRARGTTPPVAGRISEQDRRSFETYLDSDRQTANLLYQNPTLINDPRFVRDHAALHDWLDDHADAAAVIKVNPDRFLGRQRGTTPPVTGRISERDLRSFEAYLDSDWQTANLLYQNPALINDRRFVRNHPALDDWLEDHADMAVAIQANPDKFLWRQRGSNVQDFLGQLLGTRTNQ